MRDDVEPSDVTNIHHYVDMAQLCEKGMFDLFFIADTPAARTDNLHIWTRSPMFQNGLEPVTLISAIALSTKHIGLGATVSATFFEPFNIARQFASLDHISHGRAAWNVVTSANDYAARNFGLDKLPAHADRYSKARESIAVVTAYWDTWEDDAFVYDKEKAINFDPDKFHAVDFKGKYFTVHGGLNVARSPQGRPVLIQAGASEAGKDLAAETAEVVFGTGTNIAAAKEFYNDLKGRMPRFGRSPDQLKILSGLSVILGETEEAAQAKLEEIRAMVPLETRLIMLNTDLETNVLDLPLDEPVPLDRIPANSNFHKAYFDKIAEMVRSGATLRTIAQSYNRNSSEFVGTPDQVADEMGRWLQEGACDGFMISFPYSPGSIEEFVTMLTPVLQERGLLKTEWVGATLRENLGLERPTNMHLLPKAEAAE